MNFPDEDFELDQQMAQDQPELVYQPPDSTNFGSYPPHQAPPPHGATPISGKEQAIMWQQGHYMGGESGFISASTTQPSSTTGHDDDLDAACFTGPGSITGSSIYDLDSAHISEVSSCHSSQADFSLSDPAEFIPKLVGCLCDEDQVVVTAYLTFIERCVKKESFFNALIRSVNLVGAIVQTVVDATSIMSNMAMSNNNNNTNNNNNGDGEAMQQQQQHDFESALKRAKIASNILRSMTNHRDPGDQRESENQRVACQNILTAGGIPPLTGLLACTTDRIMYNAIATIHSLLLCLDQDEGMREAAKNAVREANGVHMMVALLKRDNVKLLTILTDCLRILAMKNQPTKVIILQGNGPALLVNILKQQDYKNLIIMTARLLKVLSVCPMNKPAIIQAGGMEALARHLQSEQSKITYHCSWTMRNLSDVATNIENPGPLAFELVKLLHHQDEPVIICAAGIISNLTVNNEPLKLSICDANGIRELLRVVETHGRNRELLEPAMCALRHLTNSHRKTEMAHRVFIYELQGLRKVSRWLHPNGHRPCLKALLGVIRNLAQKPSNHQIMREEEVVHQVLRLLSIYVKNAMAPNGTQPVDGIKWEEITETCLSCILQFAKDPINRTIIRDRVILHNLKQLLSHNCESIQRLSAGILHEISIDIDGSFAIQSEGLAEPINNLIHSRNEKIASFATSIMYNLTSLKKEMERGNYRPQPPPQLAQPPHMQQQMQQQQQMMPLPPQHHDERFPRGFPPDMGPGFDDMMGNPPMHQMHQGQMGGFPQPAMGGPPPHPGAHPPHSGSPQGFMDDLPGDMSMDIEGLMSPSYNSNFPQGFFDSGM